MLLRKQLSILQEESDASCSKAFQTFLEFIVKYRLNWAKATQTQSTWVNRQAAASKQAAGAQLSMLERSQTSMRTVLKAHCESAFDEDWSLQNKGHSNARSVLLQMAEARGTVGPETQSRSKSVRFPSHLCDRLSHGSSERRYTECAFTQVSKPYLLLAS